MNTFDKEFTIEPAPNKNIKLEKIKDVDSSNTAE